MSLARRRVFVSALIAFLGAPALASAQEPEATEAKHPTKVAGLEAPPQPQPDVVTPPPAPKPNASPYSPPWQMRGVVPVTSVRSDTSFAFYDKPGDATVASILGVSFKATPELMPLVRVGVVGNSSPQPVGGAVNIVNPVVGAIYGLKLGDFRLAPFLGCNVPVGMGGGDKPDPGHAAANGAGNLARSAMDGVMFTPNYFALLPGIGFAYVAHGFTAQTDATFIEFIRVRGDKNPMAKDAARSNLTFGLHVGYFLLPQLSIGAELHGQAWLANASVKSDAANRSQLSLAAGPRFHMRLRDGVWFRPGVAYSGGIDKPMSGAGEKVVQLDLPVSFQ